MTDRMPVARIPFGTSADAARDAVRSCLDRAEPPIAEVARHLSAQTGKGLRASLLLAASSGADGQVPAAAVSAAAALEILHLATLVHDDIIDDAPTRRGQPSVQSRFGRKAAVLGGDYLFCRCFGLVAGLLAEYPGRFQDFSLGMTRVCLGEIEQMQHNRDVDLGIRGYLRIISGKTAALFTLAAYAGAILAREPEAAARQHARFGFLFGMLFQIMDDCLDYEDAESDARKSVRRDLAEGVVTPPLIYSVARDPRLKAAVRSAFDHPAELRGVMADVLALDGLGSSWTLAARYYRKALRQLERIQNTDRRERLRTFLDDAVGDRTARMSAAADPTSKPFPVVV
ncbi:MAG: polyprenyl synthetase family protein [Clostridia bacterium]|nr:polyprenyl synthetase family protein [Clostridia bacterium]